MFEISKLKEKKLSELHEIAEELKISKYKTLKKLDLVYKILDHQASNPKTEDSDKKDLPKSNSEQKSRSNKKNDSDSKSKDIIAKEVHQACTDVGFFYVKNHGISHEILDKALDLSSDFFKLPQGEKEKISISNITQNQKV